MKMSHQYKSSPITGGMEKTFINALMPLTTTTLQNFRNSILIFNKNSKILFTFSFSYATLLFGGITRNGKLSK